MKTMLYNYIKTGNSMSTPAGITEDVLNTTYESLFVSSTTQNNLNMTNIVLSSNINLNDNYISNNINSVSLSPDVFTGL
jgi:hypothetical protein